MWRGGRPLKHRHESQIKKADKKETSSSVILIDSDEDEPESSLPDSGVLPPEFEQDEAEYDEQNPYEPIVQTLDLPLGLDVMCIAFPPLASTSTQSTMGSLPKIFSQKLVVVLGCSDCSIRLLMLPLNPPSHQAKELQAARNSLTPTNGQAGLFNEQIFLIASGTGQQSIPDSVSVTFTSHVHHTDEDTIMMQGDEGAEPGFSQSSIASYSTSWDLLIASHYANISGSLIVHRVPLTIDSSGFDAETVQHSISWRIQHLASPAIHIEFNPSIYPAKSHSNLLVADAKGYVRILDSFGNSTADQGSWLVHLAAGFGPSSSIRARRRPIRSARWIRGGKAIVVLLEDGEWGIWDLGKSLTMGPLPLFAINGWIGTPFDISKNDTDYTETAKERSSKPKIIPMTPGTRKIKQKSLFTGASSARPSQPTNPGPSAGGLAVLPTNKGLPNRTDDESLLLSHGDKLILIPSILTHWQNKTKASGNLFGAGAQGEAREISKSNTPLHQRTDISLFPSQSRHTTTADVMIVSEHGIEIVAPPLTTTTTTTASSAAAAAAAAGKLAVVGRSNLISTSASSVDRDKHLLSKGELDVDGMDRILNGMTNGTSRPQQQKVAFVE